MKVTTASYAGGDRSVVVSKLGWNTEGTICGAKDEQGNQIVFKEFPEWLNSNMKKINWRITYDGNKLLFLSPVQGVFTAKFVGFQAKEGEAPAPEAREGTGKFGPYVQYNFRASLRLTDPSLNGLNVVLFLTYGTDKMDYIVEGEGGMVELAQSKAKAFKLLLEFCEATGIIEQDFKYVPNLLPEWEKVAKKNNRTFSVVFRDGYIQSVVPSDEEFDEEPVEEDVFVEEEEDEEFDELAGFDEELAF